MSLQLIVCKGAGMHESNDNGHVQSKIWRVERGDAHDLLSTLEPNSVDLILTSPPYWGLRNYEDVHNWDILDEWVAEGGDKEDAPSYEWYRGHGGVLGLEPLPEWFISNLAAIIEKARPALKQSGSMWLNMGDTYFARWSSIRPNGRQGLAGEERLRRRTPMGGHRQEKQLLMIPARLAIALQDRRWILRNDLIWYKPNVPPRPFKDRLGLTHEHFFHFVRRPTEGRPKYYYDLNEAHDPPHDVVTVNARAGRDGHSATFPEDLIRPIVLSSCPEGGTILDPFCGIGTALVVGVQQGRRAIGFETNIRYAEAARRALKHTQPQLSL